MGKGFEISEKNFIEIDNKIKDLKNEINFLKDDIFWLKVPSKFKLKDKVFFIENNEKIQGVIINIIKQTSPIYSFSPINIKYYEYTIITENFDIYSVEESKLSFIKNEVNNDI